MGKLQIGWAMRDVSTTEPVNIPGQFHMRISKGILDPVTATALVLENDGEAAVFVSVDTVGVYPDLVNETRAAAAELLPELDPRKIILNATHTHAAPGQYDAKEGTFGDAKEGTFKTSIKIGDNVAYRHWLAKTLAEMVKEAWDKRAAGSISYGYGYAVVGHSRRVIYFDDVSKRPGAAINSTHGVNGHGMMYGNTDDPQFSGYEAGADHFINFLYTFNSRGKLTGAVVNVPCPSQNSENIDRLSASYWHETRKRIRKTHGNIFILPQCAAAGDLAPRQLHYLKAEERRNALKYGRPEKFPEEFRRADIAERIADAFDEVYAWAQKARFTDAEVKHDVRDVPLARRMITEAEYQDAVDGLKELAGQKFVPENGNPEKALRENSILVAGRARYEGIIRRYEEQKTAKKLPVEVHTVRVGEVAFATNPFELYMDFQHRIQARSPFVQTFIVQLCGVPRKDISSYLATKRGAYNRGYSASRFCNRISPKGGQELVEKTLKMLKKQAD